MQSLFSLGFRPLHTVLHLYWHFFFLIEICLISTQRLHYEKNTSFFFFFFQSASTLIIFMSFVMPWNRQPISTERAQINVSPGHALALLTPWQLQLCTEQSWVFNTSVEFLYEKAKSFPWQQVLYHCWRAGTTPSLGSLVAFSYFCAVAESFLLRKLCCNETKLRSGWSE